MAWDMGFAGKSAVVTGAGGGMGLAIARALLAEGARVTALDVKARPEGIDGALYLQGDIADEKFVADAIVRTERAAGRIDHLVNAAGVLWFDRDKSAIDMDMSDWDRIFAINLKGAVHATRQAVPCMVRAGGGAIVHFATIQCLRGDTKPQDAYQASKAGLIAFSKSIAVQFAGAHIRSNTICPGPTLTPMQARWDENPQAQARASSGIPLGRLGTAEDQANACLFLLSPRASFITGTELVVDGGRLALP
ncbi:MAG: SDR family NAD(P)-dependent oxidoreductase [Alphaproteobacteria bacterium]